MRVITLEWCFVLSLRVVHSLLRPCSRALCYNYVSNRNNCGLTGHGSSEDGLIPLPAEWMFQISFKGKMSVMEEFQRVNRYGLAKIALSFQLS